ncbi:hypothetical protein DDQ50_05110 [Amnibacterium flavum]|uniref:Uncharacterized protein n=1 Tax=Amnibacterium flavum TaxID=2173173 RepID=A0A2V1HZ07_9MICO|nr:hypothetical protein DDQ50_05110 [Amnibacterium flavum]
MAAAAAVVAMVLSGCAMSSTSEQGSSYEAASNADDSANYLFVQEATSGTFLPSSDDYYDLVLTGVEDHTVYFADRPTRDAGSLPTDQFISTFNWAPVAPNAAIVLRHGDSDAQTLAVTLDEPSYDASAGTVRYRAKTLGTTANTDLASFDDSLDASIPESFDDVALFIDDGDATHCASNGIAADALAKRVDGASSRVESLTPGLLLSTPWGDGVTVSAVSASTSQPVVELTSVGGATIAVTPTTCLTTPNGPAAAADLQPGDTINTAEGQTQVASATAATAEVVSLTVESNNGPGQGTAIFVYGIQVFLVAGD